MSMVVQKPSLLNKVRKAVYYCDEVHEMGERHKRELEVLACFLMFYIYGAILG